MKLNPTRVPRIVKYYAAPYKNGYSRGWKDNGLIAFGYPEPPRFKKDEKEDAPDEINITLHLVEFGKVEFNLSKEEKEKELKK